MCDRSTDAYKPAQELWDEFKLARWGCFIFSVLTDVKQVVKSLHQPL